MTIGTQRPIILKPFRWNSEKSELLRVTCGIGFERIVLAIESSGLLDVLAHPNVVQYPRQKMLVVAVKGYAYFVPAVEEDDYVFLKTIFPSRRATRDYLGGERNAEEKE